MPEHRPTQRRTDLFVRALSYLAAALLFAMMATVVADVVMRYLFAAPIRGAFEIVGFLLGVMVFAGIIIASQRNEHINVSILDSLFAGTVRHVQQAFVLLFSSVMLGFIAYRLFAAAERMRHRELLTLSFDFPVAPVVYVMAALAAVAALLVAQHLVRHLRSSRALSQDSDARGDRGGWGRG
jgi:TRAP-type C4-dicarboxylate transport system permease small subunit